MVSRTYGLTTDWIKGATVVLANGTITYCSATERPNLFWALRGAGSSMVVVAELDFNTFAAPEQVTYFDISLVWDAKKAPQVLLDAQEFAKGMPAELTMAASFNKNGYYFNGAYVGGQTAFQNAVQPLLAKLGVKVSSSKTVGWIDFIKHYSGTAEIDITTPTYNEVSGLAALLDTWLMAYSLLSSTKTSTLRALQRRPYQNHNWSLLSAPLKRLVSPQPAPGSCT